MSSRVPWGFLFLVIASLSNPKEEQCIKSKSFIVSECHSRFWKHNYKLKGYAKNSFMIIGNPLSGSERKILYLYCTIFFFSDARCAVYRHCKTSKYKKVLLPRYYHIITFHFCLLLLFYSWTNKIKKKRFRSTWVLEVSVFRARTNWIAFSTISFLGQGFALE